MPSLLAARAGADHDSPPELMGSGLFTSGRLDPLVASLLEVMTDPNLVISVETSDALGLRLTTFWRRGHRAVVGTTGTGPHFHIALVTADLLPFHLAQSVELTPQTYPRYDGQFTVPRLAMTTARRQAALEPAAAEAALVRAGVSSVWAERLVAAFLLQRSRWAMESVSLDLPRTNSSLAILDSAHAGLWRIRAVDEDQLAISPIAFDKLLERIGALVP